KFYATNPDCALRPDYTIDIGGDGNGGKLCQRPGPNTKKVQLVPFEKEKLLASMEVINSMSAYVELLTEDMATTESQQVALLKQALDHANNAQTLLGISHSKDLAQSAAAVKDLVNYFNELYIIKVNSGKIGKTVDENWVRLIGNMTVLRNDIYTKSNKIENYTFANVHDNMFYYNTASKNAKNTEFNTLKNRKEFLSSVINVNETRLQASAPAMPAIEALNAFIDKGDYLNNLYVNKTRTAAEQKRLNEILRAQVISGLKASEGLAKLLIASGIML
ncbi:TPA: hypothetical protein ACHFZQ_004864, partial [Escherichia coli]|nr:hypothetical protein [Escherichia coli]EKE6933829.1 hypothetical protein [Escherichia coli]HAH0230748.1 hypothetical protein [Escherichia coli]HBE4271980.1 hypothetical protein [Escherichia coli]HBL7742092.1 hypothetical protein [Escherichia coli]